MHADWLLKQKDYLHGETLDAIYISRKHHHKLYIFDKFRLILGTI